MLLSPAQAEALHLIGKPSQEQRPPESNTTSQPAQSDKRQKLYMWLFGLFLSVLPILVEPSIDCILSRNIVQALCILVSNTSVMYIGVSLTVSALNDLGEKEIGRRIFYMLFIVSAVFFYAIITTVNYLSLINKLAIEINKSSIICLNLLSFFVPLVFGLQQYLCKPRGIKSK